MELPPWFERFMAPFADRSMELIHALDAQGIIHGVVDLAGGRFIVVWPPRVVRDSHYRMKIITAHHDRVPGTPGALDNSAACLQLVRFLCSGKEAFNTLVIFTDKEELGSAPHAASVSTASVPMATWSTGQGSYALGKALGGKLGDSLGTETPMVFPLDVTGRGDALVLSRSAEGLCRSIDDKRQLPRFLDAMEFETRAMAKHVSKMMSARAPVFRAAVPFGEDLGFMMAGIPALTMTILPRHEAKALADLGSLPAWASLSCPGERMPLTWKPLHGPEDTVSLYTDEAFLLADRLLARLATLKVPVSVDWPD